MALPTQNADLQATAPADDANEPTVTICIAAMPDGTFSIYADEDDGQAQEGANDDESAEMAGGQTAKSIDEALQIAKQLLSAGDTDEGASDQESPEALFNQGFSQARGTPLNRG